MQHAHIKERAENVMKRFEEMLPDALQAQLEQAHRDELMLLIEAALSDVYVSTLYGVAEDLEKLVEAYKKAETVMQEPI